MRRHLLGYILVLFTAITLTSCNNDIVFDKNLFLPQEGWHYKNRAVFDIELTDTTHYHTFFINLRVTPDYEYSNLYVLLYAKGPKGDSTVRRIDLTLAESNGKWLGKGTASLISFRIPVVEKYIPKVPGVYHFEIEQNMRTNTLPEVVNVGMAVEKGEEEF